MGRESGRESCRVIAKLRYVSQFFSSIFYASSSYCQRRLVWEKRRRANGICGEGNRLKQIERDRIR